MTGLSGQDVTRAQPMPGEVPEPVDGAAPLGAASGPIPPRPSADRPAKRTNLAGLALWTTFAQLALPLTSLISGPILAHALGPDGRGMYSAVLAPLGVLGFIAAVGLPDATTYAVARLKVPKAHVVAVMSKLTLLYSVVATALLILFAPLLLHRTPEAVNLLRLSALTLPLQMFLTILRQTTAGSADFRWRNVERFLSAILRLVGLVAFALVGWLSVGSSVWITNVTGLVGIPILLLALFGLHVRRSLREDPAVRAAQPDLRRQLAAYGLRGWGGSLAYLVNWRLDQAVLVALVSTRQIGFYAVAVSLAELPQTAFLQLKNILFAESANRNNLVLVARAARTLVAFTVVLALLGVLVAPLAIPIMFGRSFEPAVAMAQILFLGTVPFLIEQVIAAGFLTLGLPGRRSIGQIVGAVITVTGLIVVCPHVGAIGAAWTSLVAYTTNALINMVVFRRVSGFRYSDMLVIRREDATWLRSRLGGVLGRGRGARR